MKNVIFISPNFPENYWHFCHELKENGMNVLASVTVLMTICARNFRKACRNTTKWTALKLMTKSNGAVGYFIWHYGRH